MRSRRDLVSSGEAGLNIWPSFTDITSTVALILFVLVLLAFIQNLINDKRLEASQAQIARSERELRRLNDSLQRTRARIEAGRQRLAESERQLEEQRRIIAESNRELGELRSRLSGIALLRVGVLEKVKLSIEAELGDETSRGEPLVVIGDNGNIVLNESLVFEYNSYALKQEGKVLLDTLAYALENLLDDEKVRANVDTIVVQGHTDDVGSTTFNRELASKRASAVLEYLFRVNHKLEESYGRYFASSAYSEFRPINAADTDEARRENRRIEISVVLRDENVRNIIQEYTEGLDPALRPGASDAPSEAGGRPPNPAPEPNAPQTGNPSGDLAQ